MLSRVALPGARRALFFGAALLVGVASDDMVQEAVSSIFGGRLLRDSQIFVRDEQIEIDIFRWCSVGDQSKDLLVYNSSFLTKSDTYVDQTVLC